MNVHNADNTNNSSSQTDALAAELLDMEIDLGLPATTCPCCGSEIKDEQDAQTKLQLD